MEKAIVKRIIVLVLAVLSTAAMCADVRSTGNMSAALNGAGIAQLVVFVALVFVYGRMWVKDGFIACQDGREKTGYGITSVVFSAFMIIGRMQEAHPDLKYGIFAVVLFGGYVPLFYVILSAAGHAAGNAGSKEPDGSKMSGVTRWLFEEHVTMGVMLAVFVCRLPYLISFYPCSMSWDGGAQICDFYEFLNGNTFSNHHPPFVAYLYGGVAYFSHKAGIPNLGMFMVPLAQTCLSAFAVARLSRLFKELKAPYGIRWASLAYFGLFTVWNIFDVTFIKDSFYWQFVLLFTVEAATCILRQDEFWARKRHIFLMSLYGVLMMQIRNNGVFVLLFTLPPLLLTVRRDKRLVLGACAAAMFAVVFMLDNFLYPAFGVVNLEVKEDTYCIMFQQTAKYGRDYPQDVTDAEREFLDTMFDYDELVKVYNPQLADWVKNCLKICEASSADGTNSEFAAIKKEYFKVWGRQLMRHPLSYIDTFLECSYGYYYPDVRLYKEGVGFYETDRNMFTEGMHPMRQIPALAPARFLLEQAGKLEYAPGIGILYRCGFYTWCVLFGAAYLLIKKRYREIAITLPALVNILVCLISPVNTCIRYALPAMCMVPLIICVICKRKIFEDTERV